MAYRMRDGVPLIFVRGRDGHLTQHFNPAQPGASRGPIIPWLNDEQREHLLRKGLVIEEIDDESNTGGQPGGVRECLDALSRLGLPSEAGAPSAGEALRAEGHRFSNDTIAAAVKARKVSGSAGALSGTAQD
jgi:hypothetical protein